MFFTCLWVHDLYILYKHNKICLILQKKKKQKQKTKYALFCVILNRNEFKLFMKIFVLVWFHLCLWTTSLKKYPTFSHI